MRKIDVFMPPMEQFCIWRDGFTAEECDTIKQVGELSEFSQAKIGYGDGVRENEDIRKTDIVWIQPDESTEWIFEKMNEIASKINFDKYQMDLDRFDGFQYSRYEEGGHYDWHTDIIDSPPGGLFRKLSFSLMLSDPEEYEGGELLLSIGGDEKTATPLKPQKGDLVVFYSHVPHKVSPVTKGQRITLVTWGLGDKIR